MISEQLTFAQVYQQFLDEMSIVEQKLFSAIDGLYSPLSVLVRAQIQHASPHKRAAVVLAIATENGLAEEPKMKRIHLAAALEMLYIALQVHQLLLQNRLEHRDDTIDKSVLGSTILAGDYCFSHAASLAVQTNDPQVVAIFSEVLQTISEHQLRLLFASDGNMSTLERQTELASFNPTSALYQAGIQAGCLLAQFPLEVTKDYDLLVARLDAQELHRFSMLASPEKVAQEPFLSALQNDRWRSLERWFTANF